MPSLHWLVTRRSHNRHHSRVFNFIQFFRYCRQQDLQLERKNVQQSTRMLKAAKFKRLRKFPTDFYKKLANGCFVNEHLADDLQRRVLYFPSLLMLDTSVTRVLGRWWKQQQQQNTTRSVAAAATVGVHLVLLFHVVVCHRHSILLLFPETR